MLSLFIKPLVQPIALLVGACFCLGGVIAIQRPQLDKSSNQQTITLEQVERELEIEKARLKLQQKISTFGFNNLVADWTFLQFLQYFGDELARDQTGYTLSPEYFEVIVNQDPRFLEIYTFLSTSVAAYAAMPERSVALMEKGLKSMSPKAPSQSYYVWRNKGIDELLFLGDGKAAQHSFEMAAQWASVHSDPESQNVAAFSRQTAQFLSRNPKSNLAQVSAWAMVLNRAVDDRTRKLAVSRIEALGGQVTITSKGVVKVFLPKRD